MIYLLWSGILFSTAVRAVTAVAKLVILGILFLTSFILALRTAVATKLVILGVSFSNYLNIYFSIKSSISS